MIEHTNELEKSLKAGTTYWDCFKGVDLRRTEIVCILWIGQTLTGQNLMSVSASPTIFFFRRANSNMLVGATSRTSCRRLEWTQFIRLI